MPVSSSSNFQWSRAQFPSEEQKFENKGFEEDSDFADDFTDQSDSFTISSRHSAQFDYMIGESKLQNGLFQ